MNYTEWIAKLDGARRQYEDGAITERELFNYVIARAMEVEQTEDDPGHMTDDELLVPRT